MKKHNPVQLNALKAFEAAARHQSFSLAAEELNVSSAAVGQLVKQLEEWLGEPLFVRVPSGKVRLITTPLAQLALPAISTGFEKISEGLAVLQKGLNDNQLVVAVSSTFAYKWLLPKIHRFQMAYPDIELRLDTSLSLLDYHSSSIDVGIRYGVGKWQGMSAEKLMSEEIFPVCTAVFYQQHKDDLKTPNSLVYLPLIHDVSLENNKDFINWKKWCEHFNLPPQTVQKGLKIDNAAAVLQTALEHHGIALARGQMVQDDLANGRLIRLFSELHYPATMAYYFVCPNETKLTHKIRVFREWLRQEAGSKEIS
ncbi:hypothetical protein A4G18_06385 [Pasteurellaceae bacterium Pebbles2]|nr:hypothetical protein [Pasteurellaceae bacterium Pebbles2]